MILLASAQTEHEFRMNLLYASCVYKDPMQTIKVLQDWITVCMEDQTDYDAMEERALMAEEQALMAEERALMAEEQVERLGKKRKELQRCLVDADKEIVRLRRALGVYDALPKDP